MIPAPQGAFFISALIVHAGSLAKQDRLWSVLLLRESYRQPKFRTLQNRSALTGLLGLCPAPARRFGKCCSEIGFSLRQLA